MFGKGIVPISKNQFASAKKLPKQFLDINQRRTNFPSYFCNHKKENRNTIKKETIDDSGELSKFKMPNELDYDKMAFSNLNLVDIKTGTCCESSYFKAFLTYKSIFDPKLKEKLQELIYALQIEFPEILKIKL